MHKDSQSYILLFTLAVCFVCSLAVAASSVSLRDKQKENALLNKKKNVLMAAGQIKSSEKVSSAKIEKLFAKIQVDNLDLETAALVDGQSIKADVFINLPKSSIGLQQIARYQSVYKVTNKQGEVKLYILPVSGKGLWSTMYGFLAIDKDTTTIRGITFYQHGETPGLGGEIENPRWQQLWQGRKLFNENYDYSFEVLKGKAMDYRQDPYKVDGLSGATLTSRGVNSMIEFWLKPQYYGQYLKAEREKKQHG